AVHGHKGSLTFCRWRSAAGPAQRAVKPCSFVIFFWCWCNARACAAQRAGVLIL
ncbi:hypothetical protein A2U01_0103348, partial [Trifolium medium]|nr:hypothetical protein [Trifolium medium]